VLALGFAAWQGWRQRESRIAASAWWLLAMPAGFAALLAGSTVIEYLRLARHQLSLPGTAGGVLGEVLGRATLGDAGLVGALLLALALMAVGFSLYTGVSWLTAAEHLGRSSELAVRRLIERISTWQDRRAGRQAKEAREVAVSEVREKLQIETSEPVVIAPAVVEIPKSERAVREKQVPLFEELPDSDLPALSLLDPADVHRETVSAETLEFTSRLIERKLLDFNVQVQVLAAYPGPVITRYEIEPATGVKGSQIVNLVKDLARSLSVISIRVVETIPGKTCMGLEIPNPRRQMVRLSEIVSSKAYADLASPLTMALGKDISGNPVVADLARMPHLLVAGTTGSGKSVAINAMILSLLYKATAAEVRLILIDPKMLELSIYDGIPHLLAPVVTDMRQAAGALNWCVGEMDRRYKVMSALGVRNLAGYNQKIAEAERDGSRIGNPFSLTPQEPEPLSRFPLIVVVIDELADLMMVVGKKVEELIARLAQKARAAGIHLIVATQRPSVDVITGLIKANIPTRIAFQVSSRIDSRTILDQMGAEALLGQGDMLYLPPGTGYPMRVHGAFVADQEVHRVAEALKAQGPPDYIEGLLDEPGEVAGSDSAAVPAGGEANAEADPMYDDAVAIVLKTRRASISLVQRHLRIGYNRAARLIEQMERAGLVSSMATNGNRDVLVPGVGSGGEE
jgi:S-DNA-T family DNA segregation ATPase FtsK/SpoIIIE